MKLKILSLCALLGAAWSATAADVIVTGRITSNTTWSASNRYLLNGYVFVTGGATLTIEPGTVVQGRVSTGTGAAALVICQGAKINAVGTAQKPIIFTSELDQLNGNLKETDTGLWGGVVILGKAVINSRADSQIVAAPITDQIEGFAVPSADIPLITYGGTDDDDNSGTLRYVSVRHGGAVIGTGNEINGFSLGGVGRGTTIEYCEVFANKDDSFEFFGGAVNARYLVSAFSNDDNFDYDQGYRGNLQFLFAIQTDIGDDRGDRGFEMDGATAPEATATPLGGGTVLNATLIGIGDAVQPNGQAGRPSTAMHLRDNGATKIYNSVFVEFANLAVVDADEQPRIDAGDLQFRNNTFWSHIAGNNTVANAFEATSPLKPAFFTDTAFGNKIENPQLRGISRKAERKLDPRPAAGSPLLGAAVTAPPNAFFTATTYRGAFGDTNWAAGWTKLWTEGWFDLASAGGAAGDTPIIAGSANKFINISTTGFAGTGAQVLTAGFVIPAGQTQTVLIRGVGPGLAALGVTGTLADPVVEVYKQGTAAAIATNDNWSGAQVSSLSAQVGAFALPAGSADSALVLNLEPGAYTVQVKGKNSATGVAIVEVYEVD
jgi:hypothetical protein